MPLYVMLANMHPEALARCNANEAAYHDEFRSPHENGEILEFLPVVGLYDYIIMAHTAGIQSAARLSGEISLKMGLTIQTLPALPTNLNEAPDEPPVESAGVREPTPSPTTGPTGAIVQRPEQERGFRQVAGTEPPPRRRTAP